MRVNPLLPSGPRWIHFSASLFLALSVLLAIDVVASPSDPPSSQAQTEVETPQF